MIWTSIVLYSCIAGFKLLNSIVGDGTNSKKETSDEDLYIGSAEEQDAESVEYIPSPDMSLQTIYWELIEIFIALTSIYLLLKMKGSVRPDFVIYVLILSHSILVNLYLVFEPENPLAQIKFLYTIAFCHMMRLNSFFFVSILCIASSIWFMNVRISTIEKDGLPHGLEIAWQVIAVALYVLFWVYYSYWDEIKKKIKFVVQYRNAKEL